MLNMDEAKAMWEAYQKDRLSRSLSVPPPFDELPFDDQVALAESVNLILSRLAK